MNLICIYLLHLFCQLSFAQTPPPPIEEGLVQGTPAHNFHLSTIDGTSVHLKDFYGKPVLLVFFGGRRCDPCIETLKEVNKLYKRERRRGLVVLAINIDSIEEKKELAKLAKRNRWRFPLLLDSDMQTYMKYAPQLVMPYLFLISRDQYVMWEHQGGGWQYIAPELYELLCNQSLYRECSNLARLYDTGKWVEQDKEKAALFANKACEQGFTEDCYHLGFVNTTLQDLEDEIDLIIENSQTVCSDGQICTYAEHIEDNSERMYKEHRKAIRHLTKGCKRKDGKSCFNLGNLFESGRAPRDKDKRVTYYYRKACKYDYNLGCYYAAMLFEYGYSTEVDLKRSYYYYKKACGNGHKRACLKKGELKEKIQKED